MEPLLCFWCHKNSPICTAPQIAGGRSDLSSQGCSSLSLLTRLSFVCAKSESERHSSPPTPTVDWCTWLDSSALWDECSFSDMKASVQRHSRKRASRSLTESSQGRAARVTWGASNRLLCPEHPSRVSSGAARGRKVSTPQTPYPSHKPGLHLHSFI